MQLRKKIGEAQKRTEKLTAGMDEKRKEVRLIEEEKQIFVQVYGDKKSEALEVKYNIFILHVIPCLIGML